MGRAPAVASAPSSSLRCRDALDDSARDDGQDPAAVEAGYRSRHMAAFLLLCLDRLSTLSAAKHYGRAACILDNPPP